MSLQRPPQLAWPYLNPNSPLYQGLVFAGLGPHPGGWDYHDCSPYRNNGRLTNMDPATDWVWVPELGRWALDVDGTSEVVDCGDNDLFTFSEGGADMPFSVSCWLKINNLASNQSIFGKYISSNLEYPIQVVSSRFYCFVYDNSAVAYRGRYATASPHVTSNSWFHLAWTYDGDGLTSSTKIYLNGSQEDDADFSSGTYVGMENKAATLRWGASLDQFMVGAFSDPLLYRGRILTLPEISPLADPSNALLAVGNCPLILTRRRLFPAAAVGGQPTMRRWGGIPHMTPGPALAGRSW